MAKRFGLSISERLKSRKQIDLLFAGGRSFSVFPIRVTYLHKINAATAGCQIGVTASKKHHSRAVDRNKIKRLLREAYRLQKLELQQQLVAGNQQCQVFFIYTGKTIESFDNIKSAMRKCLQRLSQILAANETTF